MMYGVKNEERREGVREREIKKKVI